MAWEGQKHHPRGLNLSPLCMQEVKALATAAASWHRVPARVIVWPKQEAARGEVWPRLSEPLKNGPRETWGRAGRHGVYYSSTSPPRPGDSPHSTLEAWCSTGLGTRGLGSNPVQPLSGYVSLSALCSRRIPCLTVSLVLLATCFLWSASARYRRGPWNEPFSTRSREGWWFHSTSPLAKHHIISCNFPQQLYQ